MRRYIVILILSYFFASTAAASQYHATLELRCTLSANNYPGIPDTFSSVDVQLVGMKHASKGAHAVFERAGYRFWVMTHTVHTMADRAIVTQFQVAVQNRATGEFIHALSNLRESSDTQRLMARISLVDYAKDRLLEQGEVFFQCRTVME